MRDNLFLSNQFGSQLPETKANRCISNNRLQNREDYSRLGKLQIPRLCRNEGVPKLEVFAVYSVSERLNVLHV